MTQEEILAGLQALNNALDEAIEEITQLSNNPNQSKEYYRQILKSLEKVDSCTPCIVIPVHSCGNNNNNNDISCEGATPNADFISSGDISSIEVNGVLYENPTNQTVDYFIRNHPELSNMLDVDADGYVSFVNLTDENLRVKLELGGEIFSDSWEVSTFNSNPTVNVDLDAEVVSFCLSPAEEEQFT